MKKEILMPDNGISDAVDQGLTWLIAAGLFVFAAGWAAFAIISFVTIGHWQKAYERKIALIQEGKVAPEKLTAVRKWDRHDADGREYYIIYRGSQQEDVSIKVSADYFQSPEALQPVTGYWFDSEYMVPELQPGNWHFKWVFLGVPGCISLLIAGFTLKWMNRKPSSRSVQAAIA